jgi:hypothetical protein
VGASVGWVQVPIASDLTLDEATRVELARAWLADASLEHASIASFARFTLLALSFGAPADLLAEAQHAALDEVAHAQLCFGLASRYAGSPLAGLYLERSREQPAVDPAQWHAHGRLVAPEEHACWLEAARNVIEPCADRLLSA